MIRNPTIQKNKSLLSFGDKERKGFQPPLTAEYTHVVVGTTLIYFINKFINSIVASVGVTTAGSKLGMFHLRQVFGSGHPMTWILPRLKPPTGARGGLLNKSD